MNHTTDVVSTLYGQLNADVFALCKSIKLVAFDVDGVFSDGLIYMGNQGEEFKSFNSKDGYGIKAIQKCGIAVAVITGRKSSIVEQRMTSLGVKHIYQGCEEKKSVLLELSASLEIAPHQIASVGDDMPDIGMFELSSVKVAVNDAHPMVKNKANLITSKNGGQGAVREFCDVLLQSRNKLEYQFGSSE